jgi:chemotaxis protein histidine kinase CheA
VSKAVREIVCDYIMECSRLYNFNGLEAIERVVSEGVVVKKVSKKVVKNVVKNVNNKQSWPVPFNKECIDSECCQGLKYNSGLFTQCDKDKESDLYCKLCLEECEKNGRGIPDSGNIEERMKCGLMEFKDPKGRKPTSFLSILKKKNISIEKVREDAKAMNITIDEVHFMEVTKEKKDKIVKEKKEGKQGRPKKAPKEVESSNVVDLFAELVEEAVSNNVENEIVDNVVVDNVVLEEKPKKKAFSAEDKELKAAAKAAAKAEKAAAEKEAREEKRAAEKAAKAAEKEAAKAAKEAEKVSNKKGKKPVKKAEQGETVAEVTAVTAVEEVKPVPAPKVTVTRFEHEGKKYLKSTENILYDPESKEELGIWCEESKTIKALPEDDDEEIEEEEYESEDD